MARYATGKKDIYLAAETRLSFEPRQPVNRYFRAPAKQHGHNARQMARPALQQRLIVAIHYSFVLD